VVFGWLLSQFRQTSYRPSARLRPSANVLRGFDASGYLVLPMASVRAFGLTPPFDPLLPQKKTKKNLDKSERLIILPSWVGTTVAPGLDLPPSRAFSPLCRGDDMLKITSLSDVPPSAHARGSFPKVLQRPLHTDRRPRDLRMAIDVIQRLSGTAHIFATALLITGARPQELLNLRVRDLDTRGMVYIRALKHGTSRIAYCPLLLSLVPTSIDSADQPLFRRFSYAKFYRAVKSLPRDRPNDPGVHKTLGRLFRRAYASANLCLAAGDLKVVMQSLGHKTQSSTNFYISKGGEINGQSSKRNPRSLQRQGG